MSNNHWKTHLTESLEKNLESVGPFARFASLATVRPNHTPAVRTVVIRGFAGESVYPEYTTGWTSDLLFLTTDKKTDKMNDIASNPNVELSWFMNGTFEQFRISGTIYAIEKDVTKCKLDKKDYPTKTGTEPASKSDLPLSLQSFFKYNQDAFDWRAERLRRFIEFESNLRAELVSDSPPKKTLEILSISEKEGWFQNQEDQELLEQAFDQFVLLVIKVTSVVYWSPSTSIIKYL